MNKRIITILALSVALNAHAAGGLVTDVHDGDTITVQGFAQKIRIAKIDTPELKTYKWGYQPYGSEARTNLLNLCLGKIATLTDIKSDRYGRFDANVSCAGVDVAGWQLSNGSAWPYHYNTPKKYKAMSDVARNKGLGLWSLSNAIDPYFWRKNKMR